MNKGRARLKARRPVLALASIAEGRAEHEAVIGSVAALVRRTVQRAAALRDEPPF